MDWLFKLNKALEPYDVPYLANWVEILALLITLAGFGATIWGVLSSKKAAEQARDAAQAALRGVAVTDAISELGQALALFDKARTSHQAEAWAELPDIYTELRKRLIIVKTAQLGLSVELANKVDGAIKGCKDIEALVTKFLKTAPKPVALENAGTRLRDLHDQLHELNSEIKHQVRTK